MTNSPRLHVVHVVCSDAFAGVERYVFYAARALVEHGHRVTVIGGEPAKMGARLEAAGVEFRPAARPQEAAAALLSRSLRRGGVDVVHAHMTEAEVVAVATKPVLRRPVVATLHLARRRGSTPLRRRVWAVMARGLDAQIAISEYVAAESGQRCVVVPPGTPRLPGAGSGDLRRLPIVLTAQRFEPEKRTDVAIDVWAASSLGRRGWVLHLAGGGSQEGALRRQVADLGVEGSVEFLGFVDDLPDRMRRAGIMLAPTPIDGFGLSVVEAMSAALPVVAARGGGHMETVGPVGVQFLFPIDDRLCGGAILRELASDEGRRRAYGAALLARYEREYTVERHAARLESVYRRVAGR